MERVRSLAVFSSLPSHLSDSQRLVLSVLVTALSPQTEGEGAAALWQVLKAHVISPFTHCCLLSREINRSRQSWKLCEICCKLSRRFVRAVLARDGIRLDEKKVKEQSAITYLMLFR